MAVATISGLASGIQWRDMIDQIVELETKRSLQPITDRLTAVGNRKKAWNDFKTVLTTLSSAAAGLRDGTGFGSFAVTTTKSAAGKDLFSAGVSSSASPGAYRIEVNALAKSERLRSGGSFASTGTALGLAGTFHVNGRAVAVTATDSLVTIRDRINAANGGTVASGVTASIVSVSPTEHYLTLSADETGSRGIELIDSGDGSSANGVLQQLGVLTGAQGANASASDPTRHQTQRFESKTTAVAQMLGLTAPPATASILVDGERVSIDLQSDSLSDILDKIDAAAAAGATGTTSEFVTEVVAGKTMYRLQTGTVAADPLDGADSQRIVELLGFVRGTRANETQAGADAEIEIDDLAITRRTNTVSDALDGITLQLTTAEPGSSIDLTVARELNGVMQNVQKFVDAFNGAMDFYDKQRTSGAPLNANASLRSAITSFRDILLSDVPGIDPATTAFTRLTIAGVSFGRDGRLSIDAETLRSSLTTNFSEVKNLFGTVGSTSSADATYFAASGDTTPGTYALNITQTATIATVTGAAWVGAYDGTGADEMSVLDAVTGKTATISLANGDTVDSVLAALNDQFDAQGMTLRASRTAGGELVITGSEYGSTASFTVAYAQGGVAWAGASPTGLTAGTYAGLDVQGTIGGHAATGSGRVLTGDAGTLVDGLSVRYSGTALGGAGTLTYGAGLAGAIDGLASAFTSSTSGLVQGFIQTLERSETNLYQREADVEARIERYQLRLIQQYTAMEAAMSKLQTTGSWLTSQINALGGFAPE